MEKEMEKEVTNFLGTDLRRDCAIPEIMRGLRIKSREKVVATLARLEERNIIEVSRQIGRVKYYRLKVR